MPAILALIFITTGFANEHGNVATSIHNIAIALFVFIVWLWGSRNANATIVDELRDKTWDQQRMSALSPWSMAWGKLFGATSFNWYGGIMCLVVAWLSGFVANTPDLLTTLLSITAIGVLLHATLIALNLHTSQFESSVIQRGGIGWLVIIIALILLPSISTKHSELIHWWNMAINPALFWMDSALLFAACTTFAAWRVMSNALQVRTMPWAWPTFACILTIYFTGFFQELYNVNMLWINGLLISLIMTYIALFTESNSLLRWRKLQLLQENKNYRGWLEQLPLWPTTIALSLFFALLVVATASNVELIAHSANLYPQYAITLVLMTLRDACVLLFFAFVPNSKRALGAAMLYLLVLNGLLPFFAGVAGLDTLRYFFLPFEASADPWSSVLVMTIHAALALGLVNWRLRNSQPA
ncbi:MAG: hypothetical protein WCI39_08850 [Gallionellaceae bacterium]